MGLLSWFSGSPKAQPESTDKPNLAMTAVDSQTPAPGMNGAIEVPRAENITVFEFGSVAATGDKVTLAGFCPVSDDLEPCRWQILPASGSEAPQFRVVF
ncbi:uncharacterized protein [Rutidosis leptorrhynchoides]|uniref:uncharacterized protein n=1 Tax=Rutidosis leptorrhynchoides TaxID=125765 RepID=UPI003A99A88D